MKNGGKGNITLRITVSRRGCFCLNLQTAATAITAQRRANSERAPSSSAAGLVSYQLTGSSVCVPPPGSSCFFTQSQAGNRGFSGTARGPSPSCRTLPPFLHLIAGQKSGKMVKTYLFTFAKSIIIEPYELNFQGILKIIYCLLCSVNEARNVVAMHRCIS